MSRVCRRGRGEVLRHVRLLHSPRRPLLDVRLYLSESRGFPAIRAEVAPRYLAAACRAERHYATPPESAATGVSEPARRLSAIMEYPHRPLIIPAAPPPRTI